MLDNRMRRELLTKARQSGFPGSILDVYSAYEQGKDLIAEYEQQQKVQQTQQMSDLAAQQSGMMQQAPSMPEQQLPQMPSFPPSVKANIPQAPESTTQNLVSSEQSQPVGMSTSKQGPRGGQLLLAKGGFKKDPPNQGLSSMGAENRLYTYKDDATWFDNRSRYSDNSKYSDQIKRAVYSGNYGYNPVTGVLEKLPTNKRTNVSTETQRRLAEGENKQAYQKSIVDAGFNPETFAKPTAEEEKALEDRRIKDYVIKGHELAINNPAFKAAAYLTPAGMAIGGIEGYVNLAPDLAEFSLNPSWSGAGKVGMDALMFSPLAGKIFKPQINNAKSFLTQLKGEVTQGRANREAIKEGNDWLKNWIEHPATQAKIDADINAAYNFKDVSGTPGRLINLIKDQSKTFKPVSKEYGLTSQLFNGPMHQGNAGVSYMHQVSPVEREFYKRGVYRPFDEYGSFISRDPKIPQDFRTSITVHEGTHDWVSAEALKKSGQRNIILKNLDPKSKENFLKWEELRKEGKDPLKFMNREDAYSGYLADPTEVHARIMELRKGHEIKPGDVITHEQSNDILENIKSGKTKIDPEFAKTIDKQDPKKLAELFNRLWVAAPATGVGIGIKSAAEQKAKGGFKGDPEKPKKKNILYVESKNDPNYTAYADSLHLYKESMRPRLTGKKSFGQYGSYGLRGRSVTDIPLPEGYTVPGPIQPIGQRITRGYYPEYLIMSHPPKPAGKDYRKKTHDIYKEPTREVVVGEAPLEFSEPKAPMVLKKEDLGKPDFAYQITPTYGKLANLIYNPRVYTSDYNIDTEWGNREGSGLMYTEPYQERSFYRNQEYPDYENISLKPRARGNYAYSVIIDGEEYSVDHPYEGPHKGYGYVNIPNRGEFEIDYRSGKPELKKSSTRFNKGGFEECYTCNRNKLKRYSK